MKKLLLLCIPLLMSSCTGYKGSFDCPPGVGVGCKSVTQIEEMIVETKEGPDLFIPPDEKKKSKQKPACKKCKSGNSLTQEFSRKEEGTISKSPQRVARVWIEGHTTPSGNRAEGHYVYFVEEGEWNTAKEGERGDIQ